MSYQQWREEFVLQMGRSFRKATIRDVRELLRAASSAQRQNEIECSIRIEDNERVRMEKRGEARDKRAANIAESIGARLETHGDARGCPYKLHGADGIEISIPGKGLPARCFR